MFRVKKTGEVMTTIDYENFQFMKENRAITELRKKKVLSSIKEHGYIFNPIIVNEKMEIIDGQARFEVLRDLNRPIDFIVCKGLTAKDCSVLNAYTTSWNIKDYMESYMNQGIQDYGFLFYLVRKYEPDGIGFNSVVFAINGSVESQQNIIKHGAFKCTEEQYVDADNSLAYLRRFMPTIKKEKKGRSTLITIAIMFVHRFGLVDPDRLLEKFNMYYGSDITPYYTNMETALKALNEIYNYHRAKKVHLEIEYEKYQGNRLKWYASRYGRK